MSGLVTVRDLTIRFETDEGLITAVEAVDLDIREGEILGLVGESGSGKSVLARSLMHLNPPNTRYGERSRITVAGPAGPIDVLELAKPSDLRIVRGGLFSMIFQEPMASFAPAITIGRQMVEQLQIHTGLSPAAAKRLSVDMLARVGISEPDRRFDQHALELSGGMRQRAMIAMALSTRPKLLIADEPTTALDVTIQAQVLDLVRELVAEFGMAVLLITHDLGVVAQTADRVAVMYLGRLVEEGPVRAVLRRPAHPYTKGLFAALPDLADLDAPLTPVPGDIPSPLERPSGCVFHTRCPSRMDPLCAAAAPPRRPAAGGHHASCHLLEGPSP